MSDERAQSRAKAEACRRLADLSKDAERKAFWLERAGYWEQLAAVKRARGRYRPETLGRLRGGNE